MLDQTWHTEGEDNLHFMEDTDMSERPFPIDFASLQVDPKPHTWLVLPEGFQSTATPDAICPVYEEGPDALLERFIATGLSEPRTEIVRREGLQVELCQKSLVFRFPDYITVEAMAQNSGSALAIYSRSQMGYSDLGVNGKRITRWLSNLQAVGSS